MPIVLECPQGHKLRVKDDVAGKKVRCPKCQAIVRVGKKSDSPSPSGDDEWSDFDSPEPAVGRAASRAAMPRKPGRPERPQKKSAPARSLGWKTIALLSVCGLTAAAVCFFLLFVHKPASAPEAAAADPLRAQPIAASAPIAAAAATPVEPAGKAKANAKPVVRTPVLQAARTTSGPVKTEVQTTKQLALATSGAKQPAHAVFKGVAVWDTAEPGQPRSEAWERIDPKQAKNYRFRGDCVIENEHLLFRASRDQSLSAVLSAKEGVNEKATVPITLVGRGPKSTGPVSIGIASLSDESATIDLGADGASGPKVECWLATGKHSVEIKPVAKVDRLAIGVKSQFLVVPSEFGEDLLCDALKCNVGQTYPLPSEKLVLALECDGNFMTVLTYPSIEQAGTATVGPGDGVQNHGQALDSQVTSLTAKFNGKSLFVGLLPQKDNWYYEPVNKKYSASGQYNVPWQPPYPGVWRTVGRVNGHYFSSDVPDERFVFACSMSGSLDCLFAYFDGSAGSRAIASPATIYREMLERTGKTDPSAQADQEHGQQLMRRKTKYRDVCNSADDMKDTWRNRREILTKDPDHVADLLGDCKAIIERMDRRLAEYQALIQQLGAVAAQIKQKAGGKEGADLRTFAAAVTRSQAKLKAIKMVAAAPGIEAADKIRTKLGRARGGRLDVAELDRIAESMREVANNQEVHLKKLREATLQLAQLCTKQRKTTSPGLKPYVSEVGASCRKVLRTRDPEE